MIIKSLGRKKQRGRSIRASLDAIFSYLTITFIADENPNPIFHNINMGFFNDENLNMRNTADTFLNMKDSVLNQFENLISKMPSHKSRNIFYHEILSFKRNELLPLEEQLDILRKTVIMYLQERAPDNLAFAYPHTDHDEHIHYHIMLTSNSYLEPKHRMALTRDEFSNIQKKIEYTVQSMFPQLKLETVYNQDKSKEKDYYKTGNTEYGVKQRLGDKKTYREQVKDLLMQGFDLSYDSKSFIEFINRFSIKFYTRAKSVGIVFNGKRYRLNRLGLENRHELFYQQVIRFEQNMKSIKNIQSFGTGDGLEEIRQKDIDSIDNSDLSPKEKQNLKDILEFIKENNDHSKDDLEFKY